MFGQLLRDESYLYSSDDIANLLFNHFDCNQKKYDIVSLIQAINIKQNDASELFEDAIMFAVQEAENNKIVALPICFNSKNWTSMVLWEDDGKLKAIHNNPNGLELDSYCRNFLSSCGIELSDLKVRQQIDPDDFNSGLFVVDNTTRMIDFVIGNRSDDLKELKLQSAKSVGVITSGDIRTVSSDVNAVAANLRFEHFMLLNEVKQNQDRNLSTTFRPIYDHSTKHLHIPDSRPPTALGKNQGEHVTNWSVYKRAVKKIIERDANDVEQCKESLINLFESIMLEQNKQMGSDFLKKINDVVRNYNIKGRVSQKSVPDSQQRHAINRIAQDKMLSEMARVTLSAINRLPDVTHPQEGNLKASKDHSLEILNQLDQLSSNGGTTDSGQVAECLLGLLHYPYILEADLLTKESVSDIKYQGGKLKYNKGELRVRTNDVETLSDVMARHIKILKILYPNLINSDVEEKVISKKSEQWIKSLSNDSGRQQETLDALIANEGKDSVFKKSLTKKIKYKRDRQSLGRPAVAEVMGSSDSDMDEEQRDEKLVKSLLGRLGLNFRQGDPIYVEDFKLFLDALTSYVNEKSRQPKGVLEIDGLQEVLQLSRDRIKSEQQLR